MARKLSTWTLAGLIVGPILGSGIVLLPPLAYAQLGDGAIVAWLIVLVLGAGFAGVFVRLALGARTDAGISELVAQEWGPRWGDLASNFLTGAVYFGATPVFLTAAQLWPANLSAGLAPEVVAGAFLVVTAGLLLAGLTTVSRLSLVLSSLTAVLLLAGGVVGLASPGPWAWPSEAALPPDLGPTLLILFWAVVGWEVIGTYTPAVDNPKKTLPRAGLVSLALVSLVYLVTTFALQTLAPRSSVPPSVATVLAPLFGTGAGVIAGILAGGLCLTSVLMFNGAVARMTAHRARTGALPRWLAGPRTDQPPRRAILLHALWSVGLLTAVGARWVSLEDLVSVANLFFLGNALLGLAAAWRILASPGIRAVIGGLAVVLVLLLAQGQLVGWSLLAAVAAATALQARFSSPPA